MTRPYVLMAYNYIYIQYIMIYMRCVSGWIFGYIVVGSGGGCDTIHSAPMEHNRRRVRTRWETGVGVVVV